MTDEEKKEYEELKSLLYTGTISQYGKRKLIDIIEKQSKEIEHQIEKRANQRQELAILNAKQIEFNKLVNTVNSYKGQFKRQQKEIEEYKKQLDLDNECEIALNSKVMDLEKEIEELKEKNKFLNWYFENQKENFIHKDKIKAKIEEIENEDKKYKNYLKDGRENFTPEYVWARPVLQSLLEKE